MGTSMSSRGPGGNSPLVPSWADDRPQEPIPVAEPGRFRSFRLNMGKFVRSGDKSTLKSSLGNYARKSSGGGGSIVRRMGTVTAGGGALFDVMRGIASGDQSQLPASIDLNFLSGQPCDSVVDVIVTALTPANGDSDKVRAAMNEALSEALEGMKTFDPNAISDELIIQTMVAYLAENIFLQIMMDADRAFNKTESPVQRVTAEVDLKELVKVVVDSHMAPLFENDGLNLKGNEVVDLQRRALNSVWTEWEAY